jgi:hypothetical protein
MNNTTDEKDTVSYTAYSFIISKSNSYGPCFPYACIWLDKWTKHMDKHFFLYSTWKSIFPGKYILKFSSNLRKNEKYYIPTQNSLPVNAITSHLPLQWDPVSLLHWLVHFSLFHRNLKLVCVCVYCETWPKKKLRNYFTHVKFNSTVATFTNDEYFTFNIDVRNSSYTNSQLQLMQYILLIFICSAEKYLCVVFKKCFINL